MQDVVRWPPEAYHHEKAVSHTEKVTSALDPFLPDLWTADILVYSFVMRPFEANHGTLEKQTGRESLR